MRAHGQGEPVLRRRGRTADGGFTLVELAAAVAIIGILIALIIFISKSWIARAEGVRCASNMRSLHVSLATYTQDRGQWPQEPPELWGAGNNDSYEDWWVEELRHYGATENVWKCPTILRLITNKMENKNRPRIHYTPTMFDEGPYTAYKWKNQPWLTEIGNMHGQGALLCFPDGSVRSMDDVMRGR